MIIIATAAIGVFLGLRSARSQGGARADLIQYGGIYGLAGALIGLFVTVILDVSF